MLCIAYFSFGCLALLSYLLSLFLKLVESYKMKNNPHGYCVILNNYIFKNPCEAREGTMEDGGKYFFKSNYWLVCFSDNFLKELSNISHEEESC